MAASSNRPGKGGLLEERETKRNGRGAGEAGESQTLKAVPAIARGWKEGSRVSICMSVPHTRREGSRRKLELGLW